MKQFWDLVAGILVSTCLFASGCGEGPAVESKYAIAVTNSYLQCAVQDVWGEDVAILCLAPPGMCPGHFDISPVQVRQLKGCKLLLRFDFQQGIEDRLTRLRDDGLDMESVPAPTGLCVPDSYKAVCRRVCEVLSQAYPQDAARFETRLEAIDTRLDALAGELQNAVRDSGIAAAAVLTSNHQAEFVKWLGLDPVATFVGSDTETVANIDHCLKMTAGRDIRFVIANRQEGIALAQALAERCQARAVVFSNFPDAGEQGTGFDRLLRDNVGLLCEAGAK